LRGLNGDEGSPLAKTASWHFMHSDFKKEEKMKHGKLLGAVPLIIAMATQVFAWELNMKGDWEWRYRYWTLTGNNDIFGEMDDAAVNLGINHMVVCPTRATTNRINTNGFGFNPPGGFSQARTTTVQT